MSLLTTPLAEVDIDVALIEALVRQQAPGLADRPVELVGSGWDNVVARLGADVCVRLPRRAAAVPLLTHEQQWLPHLAPRLPLPVPAPVLVGGPGAGYPWPWSIVAWFQGRSAAQAPPTDMERAVDQLGDFLSALHQPAPPDAPENPVRGRHLDTRRERTDGWLQILSDRVDPRCVGLWRDLCAEPPYQGPPVWLHGDLHPDNLVVDDSGIVAVIDFGDLTSGDPATDLAIVWFMVPPDLHQRLRERLGVDDATWRRGGGWALSLSAAMLAHSADSVRHTGSAERALSALLDARTSW